MSLFCCHFWRVFLLATELEVGRIFVLLFHALEMLFHCLMAFIISGKDPSLPGILVHLLLFPWLFSVFENITFVLYLFIFLLQWEQWVSTNYCIDSETSRKLRSQPLTRENSSCHPSSFTWFFICLFFLPFLLFFFLVLFVSLVYFLINFFEYNLHTLKCKHFKSTVQWDLTNVCTTPHAPTHLPNQNIMWEQFHHHCRLLWSQSLPPTPAPGSHWSTFLSP